MRENVFSDDDVPEWADALLRDALEAFDSGAQVRLFWTDEEEWLTVRGDAVGGRGRTVRYSGGGYDMFIDSRDYHRDKRSTLLHEIAHVLAPGGHDKEHRSMIRRLHAWDRGAS